MDAFKSRKPSGEPSLDEGASLSLTDFQLSALGFNNGFGMKPPLGTRAREEFSLRTLLYIIFRHKWKVLACFLVVTLLTGLFVKSQPHQYASEARLIIRSERQGVAVDPMAKGPSLLQPSAYGGSQGTEFGILTSSRIAEEVVRRLGVEYVLGIPPAAKPDQNVPSPSRSLPGRWAQSIAAWGRHCIEGLHSRQKQVDAETLAVQEVRDNFKPNPYRDSQVMILSYTDHDARRAQMILNAIIDVYMADHIEIYKSQISSDYFKSKASEWKTTFDQKKDELQKLLKQLDISSIDEEKTQLSQELTQLHGQMAQFEVTEKANEARLQKINELMKNQATGANDPAAAATDDITLAKLHDRLLELQLQKAQLSTTFVDKAPQVRQIQAQITTTEQLILNAGQPPVKGGEKPVLTGEAAGGLKTRYQDMLLERQATEATRKMLSEQINEARTKLDTLLSNEQHIQNLNMEIKVLEEQYMQYLNSNQITEISQTLDQDRISNVRILQKATLSGISNKSQRKILALMLFGCFLGLLTGVGLATGLEFLDQSIKTAEDVEKRLGLPLLISIPRSEQITARMKELTP